MKFTKNIEACLLAIGSAGDTILKTRPGFTFLRAGQRGQKVRCCLSGGTVEAHVNEKRFGVLGWPEVNLTALVWTKPLSVTGRFVRSRETQMRTENSDLVEALIRILWGLVEGDARRDALDLGTHFQGLAKFDSIGCIKASGGVVPALKRSQGQCSLDNGHTLPLTARHASNEGVANLGVPVAMSRKKSTFVNFEATFSRFQDAQRMGHAISRGVDVYNHLCVFVWGDSRWQSARGAAASSKIERLSNGQRRKVNVDFSHVSGLETCTG